MALTRENIRSQLSWVDRMNLLTELLTSSENGTDEHPEMNLKKSEDVNPIKK